jgi:hypothetical protein
MYVSALWCVSTIHRMATSSQRSMAPRLLKRLCDTKTPWRSLGDSVGDGNFEHESREGIEMSLASGSTVARLGLISSLVG